MDTETFMTHAARLLRKQAGMYYLVAVTAAAAGALVFFIADVISLRDSVLFFAVCLFIITLEAIVLWKGLEHNSGPSGSLREDIGVANGITLFRGWLIAVTAGVLTLQGAGALPARGTLVAWIPAVIYTLSLILDAFDGFIARKTGSVTLLGRLLENEYDSLGVLVLALYISATGRGYPFIALVGLARYLFVFGMWARRRLGLKTHGLSHTQSGKVIAGIMMGYLSAGLWPLFADTYFSVAGMLFFIPFAGGFLRDWLVVCGTINLDSNRYKRLSAWFMSATFEVFPVFLRATMVGMLIWLAIVLEGPSAMLVALAVFLGLGAGGRAVAIAAAVLIAAGVVPTGVDGAGSGPVSSIEPAMFVLFLLIFLCGTGRFSLWQPETRIFGKRDVSA